MHGIIVIALVLTSVVVPCLQSLALAWFVLGYTVQEMLLRRV
jgi:hypothetical protein